MRGRNHAVRTANSREEAEAALAEQDFDLIIADVQVAGSQDQPGLVAWLAANRPALEQRVVLMRAAAPSGLKNEEARNAFPILQKPFKAADLLAVVETALGDLHAAPIER